MHTKNKTVRLNRFSMGVTQVCWTLSFLLAFSELRNWVSHMAVPIFWPANEQREVIHVFCLRDRYWHLYDMSPEMCIPQTWRTLYTKSFKAACTLSGCCLFQLAYFQSAKKETTAKNPSLYSSQSKHRKILLNGPVHQSKLQSHERKLSS